MQKKSDNFLDKIVKKDYNNELEQVLEKKHFDENVKSVLLDMLYKIETSYKDYKNVKQNVVPKEEFVENIINIIKNNCNEIKLVKPNSKESKIIGNRTILVEKNKKRIICYYMERKLLYCISKISKKEEIINEKYFLINKTLSNLINVGNNINTVEPLRDFNGYSWTTIPNEIESLEHNLVYQNLIILVGTKFLDKWVYNNVFIMDYMKMFEDKLQELYGNENKNELIENLKIISILLDAKFDKNRKEEILKIKEEIEKKLFDIKDNKNFVEKITEQKKQLVKEIKKIDKTLNSKKLIQEEYKKRNENLNLEEKIFSIRILSKLMIEERDKKIKELENLNDILKPQKFVKYKKMLEEREKYLKLLETKDIQKEIDKIILKIQKTFLKCYEIKIDKAKNKQEITKIIYEFRYYNMLLYKHELFIYNTKELEEELEILSKKILKKAQELKVIEKFSRNEDINYSLQKNIFNTRSINLEEIYVKLTKDKEKYYLQAFDGKSFEEKIELKFKNINRKDLNIMLNKKVKVFN